MSQNGSSSNDLVFGIVLGIIITIGLTLIIEKNSEKNLRILQAQQQAESNKNNQPKMVDYEADKLNREILNALDKLSKSNKDSSYELQIAKLEQLILSQNSKIEELKTQKSQCLSSEKTKQSENDELAKKIDRTEFNYQTQNQRLDFLQKQLIEAQKTNELLLATQKQILESIKSQKVEVYQPSNRVESTTPVYISPKEVLQKSPEAPVRVNEPNPVANKEPSKPKLVRTLPAPEKQPVYKPNDRLE